LNSGIVLVKAGKVLSSWHPNFDSDKMAKVEIDDDIYSVLEARSSEKDFEKTDEYVRYLLKQVVEKIKKEKQGSEYSEEEEKKVKKRLKDLGYMD